MEPLHLNFLFIVFLAFLTAQAWAKTLRAEIVLTPANESCVAEQDIDLFFFLPSGMILSSASSDSEDNAIITVELPGFTTSNCDGVQGQDIWDVVTDNQSDFQVVYREGTPQTMFSSSYLTIEFIGNGTTFYPLTRYQLSLNSSNGIRASCKSGLDAFAVYDNLYFSSSTDTKGNITFPTTLSDVSSSYHDFSSSVYFQSEEAVDSPACYLVNGSVTFYENSPALPKLDSSLNITFTPSQYVYANDTLRIYLRGFTNGECDMESIEKSCVNGSNLFFQTVYPLEFFDHANWTEGSFVHFAESNYYDSFLDVKVAASADVFPAFSNISILIPAVLGLKSYCGMEANNLNFTVSIFSFLTSNQSSSSSLDYSFSYEKPKFLTLFNQSIPSSTLIGKGCTDFGSCHSHGTCNYCTQTCSCYEGFRLEEGVPSSYLSSPLAIDCSERICPFYSSQSGVLPTSTTKGHPATECASNGICNRRTGKCECFDGFEGSSCQRKTVTGGKGGCLNQCSGRGVCMSLEMVIKKNLITGLSESTYYAYANLSSNNFAFFETNTNSFDLASNVACVCDSSWSVGFGSNETQEAEFFGPDCSMRRCPSGDNPDTEYEDETDCSGVNGGASGNKCHVDCSDRGICNYSNGICSCFEGYYGAACSKKRV